MIGMIAAVLAVSGPTQTELTIYNQGFGLVKETRKFSFRQGRQTISVEDVPSLIQPTSVGIRGLTDANAFSVLEQNYQYDLISPQAILNKSVGKRIRFVRSVGNLKEVVEGTLLSSPIAIVANPQGGSQQTYNGMVIRTDDNRILLNPTGEIDVASVPEGLISKPTLLWDVQAERAHEQSVELSYVSNGLSWSADYVLTLDGTGGSDVQGWVTLNNSSGATWKDAKLKLLAGDVNVIREQIRMPTGRSLGVRLRGKTEFQEETLFEYHLYTLERPATVRNRETKQLSLLEGHGIPVQKRLVVDSISGRYFPTEGEIGTGDVKPQVRLEFVNDKKSGLGMPLPKGKFKVYQRDKSGSVQLLGEDQIDHTPRNERVSLVMGRSFDVVASRKRTSFNWIKSNSARESFEIEVRNRSAMPESVEVLERHYGDWTITSKSQEFAKLDSNTAQFKVDLLPNQVKKVIYTVETKW